MNNLTLVLGWIVSSTGEFWTNAHIVNLIGLAKWAGRAVFLVSVVVVFLDVFEDMAAGKMVYTSTITSNVAKALLFVELAPTLGQYSLALVDTVVGRLNLSAGLGGIENSLMGYTGGAMIYVIFGIACVAFLIMILKRFGMMLIQIVTYVLYVPGVLRGDSTAMSSWLRQTIAIAVTFFMQYTLFYLGLYFWFAQEALLTFGLWLSMGMVARVLDKFGLSAGGGSGGMISSIGTTAIQGISMLAR